MIEDFSDTAEHHSAMTERALLSAADDASLTQLGTAIELMIVEYLTKLAQHEARQ